LRPRKTVLTFNKLPHKKVTGMRAHEKANQQKSNSGKKKEEMLKRQLYLGSRELSNPVVERAGPNTKREERGEPQLVTPSGVRGENTRAPEEGSAKRLPERGGKLFRLC